jgi:hypothetical protein
MRVESCYSGTSGLVKSLYVSCMLNRIYECVDIIRDRVFQVWRVPPGTVLKVLLLSVCKEGGRGRTIIVRVREDSVCTPQATRQRVLVEPGPAVNGR